MALKAPSMANASTGLPCPPFIIVEGVTNFRDLGGYSSIIQDEKLKDSIGQSARSIRPGYLFRCAQPSRITSTGTDTLTSNLHIRTLYDLRSFAEIQLMASRYPGVPLEIPGIIRHHIPIYKDEDYSPISMAQKYDLSSSKSAGSEPRSHTKYSKDGFVQAYEDILRQAAASGSFRTIILHILNRPEEPLLFHCTVGKDRTGVFAALVLKLCGVDDKAIIWDYALTTQGLGSWREYLIKRIMDGAGGEYRGSQREEGNEEDMKRAPTREEAEKIVGSHAEDMKAFLEQVLRLKFGSARQYFREFCGFNDDELNKVVKNLVINEPGSMPPDGL